MHIPANRPVYQHFPRDFRQPFRTPYPSMRPMPPMPRPNFGRYQIPPHHHFNNKMVNQNIRWRSPNPPLMIPAHFSGHLRQPLHPDVHLMRFNLIRPRSQTEDRIRASSAFDSIDLSGIGERLGILKQDESNSSDSLMTRKEKEWLLKIQLLQLNNQDPYYDDYYFQVIVCITHYAIV